mmetsp:Transcript_19040/g.73293  ORF Transcript_19040/g.73293 Transcript_19040/m.73293 type:complete len:208 (+) Transcript_19040:355-978(+)
MSSLSFFAFFGLLLNVNRAPLVSREMSLRSSASSSFVLLSGVCSLATILPNADGVRRPDGAGAAAPRVPSVTPDLALGDWVVAMIRMLLRRCPRGLSILPAMLSSAWLQFLVQVSPLNCFCASLTLLACWPDTRGSPLLLSTCTSKLPRSSWERVMSWFACRSLGFTSPSSMLLGRRTEDTALALLSTSASMRCSSTVLTRALSWWS